MRTKHRLIAAAVAGLAGLLASLVAAGPAQAAPDSLSQSQVNETTNRYTPVGAFVTRFGVAVEIRAGYYQGSQYGWARLAPSSRWRTGDTIWLRIMEHGSWRWAHGTLNESSQSSTHTPAQRTIADPNYKFAACVWRGGEYDCGPTW